MLYGRTNNAFAHSFANNALNQPYATYRSGTLTVAGLTTPSVTTVKVKANGDAGVDVTPYADKAFARSGVNLIDGTNTFIAEAQGSLGRKATNTVSVALPVSVTWQHDGNGNLISDGRRGFEYDDEDQLVAVTVTNSWRSEFAYDALGRRRVRLEKQWNGSSYATVSQTRYVYDGMLVVQERDANNVPTVTYTRGRDLSGARLRAGGIGGLLAMTRHGALAPEHHYYHADGSGNVTALVDAGQRITARYAYDPYGNLLGMAGPMAEANVYRFSSKEYHPNSGLYYYGFRFYEPSLQRWINRDPIGESGGINLYGFVGNSPMRFVDPWGFLWYDHLAEWFEARVDLSKDWLDNSLPPWIAWMPDTALDLGLGLASTPATLGHYGEGAGTFSGDPTLENAAGLALDVSLTAGAGAGFLGRCPSANRPIRSGGTTSADPPPASQSRCTGSLHGKTPMDPAKDPNRGKVLPVIDPDTRQPTGQYINYDDVPWGNLTTFDENGNPVAFPNSTDPHQGPLTWDILDLFENLNNPYL